MSRVPTEHLSNRIRKPPYLKRHQNQNVNYQGGQPATDLLPCGPASSSTLPAATPRRRSETAAPKSQSSGGEKEEHSMRSLPKSKTPGWQAAGICCSTENQMA